MNKKISCLLRVIIGERLPVGTLELRQSRPLGGLHREATTLRSGRRGWGEFVWEWTVPA